MEKAKEFSNFKLYGTLFALGCAGGTIYIIPYVRLVFYDLLLEVAGMNNTQLAAINPITTVVSTFTAIPIAIIVDRLNLKDGIKWALIITTLLAIMYSFLYTSYIVYRNYPYIHHNRLLYIDLLAGILKDFEHRGY